jgi:hypothetical protein
VVPHRSQNPSEVAAVHDYVLRPPEEIPSPSSRAGDEQTTSQGKRRWIAVIAAAVMVAIVAVAVLTTTGPTFFVRDGGPPQFRVTSTPGGARILVGSLDTGLRTPAEVQVTQLPATVRLELPGFQPFVTEVTEQNAKEVDRSINANMVKLPTPSPPSEPAAASPATAPATPVPSRPLAELKVLRAPGPYAFCTAAIGRSWTGYPFDGVTSIRLPAQRYSIRIECSGQPPILGEIEVPAGKNERNFNEVVNLNPTSEETPVPR